MVTWLKLLRCLLFGIGPMVFTGGWAADPTLQPLPRLETGMHTATIWRIATDATGRWAVTASDDKTARVWEVASGRPVAVFRPPQDVGRVGKLYAVALSPDGKVGAVGGWTKLGSETGNTIYFFDRASGRLLHRLSGLPNNINHLAFSPDGRWLAASLGGKNGVRLFDALSGEETGSDAEYGFGSYSAHFRPDGQRLLATSIDGDMRLYTVEEGKLGPPKRARPGGGKVLIAARFSPDGQLIAAGFQNSTMVQVLDADTLAEVARPVTTGVDNGDLANVVWSADGHYLLAGGRWNVGGKIMARRWAVGDWSRYENLPLASGTVMDLVPLPGGGVLFAADGPAWGIIDPAFRVQQRRDGEIADLRGPDQLRLSIDGRRVGFGYQQYGEDPRSFDVASHRLEANAPELTAARTAAPGLDIRNWKNYTNPTLNGQALKLDPFEPSRSLAISPDGQRFVLGTEWYLRLFDRSGDELWRQPAPGGSTWAVNWSADGRFVVAACADGTIRWHRPSDGAEVLALFPHADQKRWIAWTPEGFYATSGSDADELMGYHLNRGKDREGVFISARQLSEHFYQPGLISRRLDADGDALVAEAVKKLGDVQQLLAGAKALAPLVELLTGLEVTGEEEVTITVRVKDQGGGVGGLEFYVDGQPQTGRQAGLFADGTESRTFAAPPGARRIEVAALSRTGVVKSERQVVMATLTGPARDAALHILAVGVEKYQAPGLELKHSAADAKAVANEIAIRAKPLFKRGVSTPMVLTDSDASLAGIEGAFHKLKARMKPQDTLVIFLAGHGEAPIGKGYTFLPWDFKRGASGDAGEGLSEARLRKLLGESPAQTLVLLDTCDAGGAAEMIEAAYERLNGVSKHVVIGASRRGQFAKEGFEGHGVFTAALLRVMKRKPDDEADRTLRVPAIRVYVDQEVRKIVREMRSSSQQTVSGFLGSANFPLIMQ